MNTNIQPPDPLEEALIQAGAFHPDDLACNQAGKLSPAQQRWMQLEIAGWLALAAPETGIAIFIWVFYFLRPIQNILLLGLFWGTALIGLAILCIRDARVILDELQDGQVVKIEGVVSKHFAVVLPYGSATRLVKPGSPWIEIRNRSFDVHTSVYWAIADHQSYRVFYTPKNKTVVNIEPLSHARE